jgi:glycosyltransferase involved in cell wall biosynthesis
MLRDWPAIKFVVLSHSNVGFLQADPDGVARIREYIEIAKWCPNLSVGGNSHKFASWLSESYGTDAVWLPNIYPFTERLKFTNRSTTLRIGAFGAVRPEKNFMTAAAAALLIAKRLNKELEFHMSSGGEGDQGRTAPAIDQMFAGIHGVKIVRHNWQPWDAFIKTVQKMDLLIQLSYTESFNMVTADGVAQGVPSVVSPAIIWAPDSWKAEPDSVLSAAAVGIRLLTDEKKRAHGAAALAQHNRIAVSRWLKWLGIEEKKKWWQWLF